jgi:hypothetical protein
MSIEWFGGPTARSPQLAADKGRWHLRWWKGSLLSDVVIALALLAGLGVAMRVGSLALELIAFH